ncbi:unnamed protein product, partial [Prorocentrum cordatum]
MVGVRGQCWAVPSGANDGKYLLMSSATLVEAVYIAFMREPRNRYVRRSLSNGVSNYLLFRQETPDDVLIYLKELNNAFHRGAGTSFLETMDRVGDADKSWKIYAREKRITSRSCPSTGPDTYLQQCWKHVSKQFPGVWKNNFSFTNSKVIVSGLDRFKMGKQFLEAMCSCVNFCHPSMNTEKILASIRDVLAEITKTFSETIPEFHLIIILTEAFKFCVPKDLDDEDQPDMAVETIGTKIDLAAEAFACSDEEEGATGATGSAGAQVKAPQSREKKFLDELHSAVVAVVRKVPDEKLSVETLRDCYRNGMHFAAKSKVINEQLFSDCETWTALRSTIRRVMRRHHGHVLDLLSPVDVEAAGASSQGSGNRGDVDVDIDLKDLNVPDGKDLLIMHYRAKFTESVSKEEVKAAVRSFVDSCDLDLPVDLRGYFVQWSQRVLKVIKPKLDVTTKRLDISALIECCATAFKNDGGVFLHLEGLMQLCECAEEEEVTTVTTVPDYAIPEIWGNDQRYLDAVSNFRATMMIAGLPKFASFVSQHDSHLLSKMSGDANLAELISNVDVWLHWSSESDSASWSSFWQALLRCPDIKKAQQFADERAKRMLSELGARATQLHTEAIAAAKEKKLAEVRAAKAQEETSVVAVGDGDKSEPSQKRQKTDQHVSVASIHAEFAQAVLQQLPQGEDPHAQFMPTYIMLALSKAESSLMTAAICGPFADQAWDCLYTEHSKVAAGDAHLFASPPKKTIRLTFAGKLSLLPAVGSIHVGTLFNVNMYLRPPALRVLAGTFFMPAWLVRTCKLNGDGFPLETPTCEVHEKKISVEFEVPGFLGAPGKLVKFDIKHFYVVLKPEFASEVEAGSVEMIRAPMKAELCEVSDAWAKSLVAKARERKPAPKAKASKPSHTD